MLTYDGKRAPLMRYNLWGELLHWQTDANDADGTLTIDRD